MCCHLYNYSLKEDWSIMPYIDHNHAFAKSNNPFISKYNYMSKLIDVLATDFSTEEMDKMDVNWPCRKRLIGSWKNVQNHIRQRKLRRFKDISSKFNTFFMKVLKNNNMDMKSFYVLQLERKDSHELILDSMLSYLQEHPNTSEHFKRMASHLIEIEYKKLSFVLDKLMLGGSLYHDFLKRKFPKNKKFRFKLCCDGREINGQSQIGLALVPLDMQDIFGTQEVLSVFYFALIEGAETKETIQSYLTKYYKKEIEQIQEKGVKIDGVDISLDLFYCSDLKNVRQTMDDNCFCCKFNKGVFKLGDLHSREKCSAFGIKYFKHIICLLHMKQRIHERIMAIIGNSLIDQDFQTFTCGDFYWKLKSDIPKEEQLDNNMFPSQAVYSVFYIGLFK